MASLFTLSWWRFICVPCVLFPQTIHRGLPGALIVKPLQKHTKFTFYAKKHQNSQWPKESSTKASNFLYTRRAPTADIVCQIDDHTATSIERNRNKLFSIVSTLLTCGQCDFAVRGKESKGRNFDKLLKFRIEAGDKILEDHIKNAPINAKYTSHCTQNEILNMCELVLREQLIKLINNSHGFSILADETADISGVEQLSLGARFVDPETMQVREEFLGYTPLEEMDANSSQLLIEFFKSVQNLH